MKSGLHTIVALLLFAFTPSVFAQQSIEKSKSLKGLEKTFEEIIESYNCPGMSIVVVKKNEIVYAKGFGYADVENKRQVNAETVFPIGSSTKAFTAAIAGQLEKDGKLDFDKSPRTYMPKLSFYNEHMNSLITIRDMLSHQTGLPRHDFSWYFFPTDSRDSLIQRIAYLQPSKSVRETFQYNNFMYTAVAAVTDYISGNSWEQNITNNILKPLEMNQTTLSISDMEKNDNKAVGYDGDEDGHKIVDYYQIRGMAPAGGINSNALEMGHWISAWINGGMYKGSQVIPTDFVTEAISSQMVIAGALPGKTHPDVYFANYGLGWFLASYRGHYRVEHGGNIDGFSTSVSFFPTDSIGIAVLVNQNFSAVPDKVRNVITDKMLGLPDGKWYKDSEKEDKNENQEETISSVSNRIIGTHQSHELSAYEGQYSNLGYGDFSISLNGDSVIAHFPERKFYLKHKHYDVFTPYNLEEVIDTTESGNSSFNFHSNMHGEIDGVFLNIELNLDPLLFSKLQESIELKSEDLERFVGKYDFGGAFGEVFINDKNNLSLVVPGQPEYTLSAKKKNKFTVDKLDGYELEFEEKEGNVTALILIQPNGTFRVPKSQ